MIIPEDGRIFYMIINLKVRISGHFANKFIDY